MAWRQCIIITNKKSFMAQGPTCIDIIESTNICVMKNNKRRQILKSTNFSDDIF